MTPLHESSLQSLHGNMHGSIEDGEVLTRDAALQRQSYFISPLRLQASGRSQHSGWSYYFRKAEANWLLLKVQTKKRLNFNGGYKDYLEQSNFSSMSAFS